MVHGHEKAGVFPDKCSRRGQNPGPETVYPQHASGWHRRARIGVPYGTKGPGRPGRIVLAFLTADEDGGRRSGKAFGQRGVPRRAKSVRVLADGGSLSGSITVQGQQVRPLRL